MLRPGCRRPHHLALCAKCPYHRGALLQFPQVKNPLLSPAHPKPSLNTPAPVPTWVGVPLP